MLTNRNAEIEGFLLYRIEFPIREIRWAVDPHYFVALAHDFFQTFFGESRLADQNDAQDIFLHTDYRETCSSEDGTVEASAMGACFTRWFDRAHHRRVPDWTPDDKTRSDAFGYGRSLCFSP
jgi:hypothetical protein